MAGKRTFKIVVAAAVLVILAMAVSIVLLLSRLNSQKAEEEEPPKMRSVVLNEENLNEVSDAMREKTVEPGYFEVKMNMRWEFEAGSAMSSNARVDNVIRNTNDIYFDLELPETDEVIYESPLIPRGSYVTNIELNRVLDAGSHPAVVVYHLVDDEQRTVSTLRVAVTLVVNS